MAIKIKTTGFDHIVLNVADVERSLTFYCDVLGLSSIKVDEWRAGEVGFPSVRVSAESIIDLAEGSSVGSNLNHYCLVIEPIDFDNLIASGELDVEKGPLHRSGAKGTGLSIYVRDPDNNLIELRYYE
jgi:catechol 2,3-dioxygenase-like lactoylglutathione lyase family enzyme